MSKTYIWNKDKSVLSFKGNTLKKGDVIPDEMLEVSLNKLIKAGKVIEKPVESNKPNTKLDKARKDLEKLEVSLKTAKEELSSLAADATAAKKTNANKRVDGIQGKIDKLIEKYPELTGGE